MESDAVATSVVCHHRSLLLSCRRKWNRGEREPSSHLARAVVCAPSPLKEEAVHAYRSPMESALPSRVREGGVAACAAALPPSPLGFRCYRRWFTMEESGSKERELEEEKNTKRRNWDRSLKSATTTVEPCWNWCCFWRFGREACSDLLLVLVLAAAGASAAISAAIKAIDLVPIPPFLRPAATLFSLFTARTIIGDTVKLLELLLLLMRVRTKLESRLILWVSTN
ncbi:uncharacterized protein DS421_19g655600 [Arachis hypogaea]|uniref:Uncharacterized protein n=1 Tax=Arachis hypogaea TaxID=3818 RepID=A0A6B9V9R3_ARAHY|nr:uncharacterized protein DS421_19g655600 [Arachis hypogaea]